MEFTKEEAKTIISAMYYLWCEYGSSELDEVSIIKKLEAKHHHILEEMFPKTGTGLNQAFLDSLGIQI